MSSYSCNNKCVKEQKHAFYWQGYKRCSICEVWINNHSDNNKCYCCSAPFKNKPNKPNKTIRIINLFSNYIVFNYNSSEIIMKSELREIFDECDFSNKITIINNVLDKTDPEILFILINYFAGKKYRLARPIGHGNEQIQFIKHIDKNND